VLGLSLTGYLLPWDQKGYWATKVATNIAGTTPGIGPQLQELIIGGTEYGHHTLTRFFALHAGVLPALLIGFVIFHVYVFRRHGIKAYKPVRERDAHFWPDQILKDAVACLAVLCVVLFLVVRHYAMAKLGGDDASLANVHLGADLGPPAEPTENYDAARPEWYFLSLYQLLKYVPEHVGAFIVPGVAMGVLALMPFVGRWKLGHAFNVFFLLIVLAGAIALTGLALTDDRANGEYKAAVALTHDQAERVQTLITANKGIPPTGALTLMRDDPYIMGPRLFKKNCAACHRYNGHDGTGYVPINKKTGEPVKPSGADLYRFASREWLTEFLSPDHIVTDKYWGGTKFVNKDEPAEGEKPKHSRMVRFTLERISDFDEEAQEHLRLGIIALSAYAELPYQREADAEARQKGQIKAGLDHLDFDVSCSDCHEVVVPDPGADAPSLIGYGSKEWLVKFLADPRHPKLYGEGNDRMPSYGKDQILTKRQIEMIADWLRESWYEPDSEAPTKSEWPWQPPAMSWSKPKATSIDMKWPQDQTPTDAPSKTVDTEPDSSTPPKPPADATDDPDTGSPFDADAPKPAPSDTPSPFDPAAKPNDPKSAGPTEVPDVVDFVKHVQPILEANCLSCHGPTKPKGKLRMDTKAAAFTPGSSDDPPIVPGKPAESLWFQLIIEPDEEFRMPPKGGPLTLIQIETIKKWIEQGAKWPDDVTLQAVKTDN